MTQILVVDDQPEMRWLLTRVLEGKGYRVSGASDGEEALHQIARDRPDLVVMDVIMPNMDGKEACRRIKADPDNKDLPIILLTAPWSPMDEWLSLEVSGADRFVSKPFDNMRLLEAIEELLAVSQQVG